MRIEGPQDIQQIAPNQQIGVLKRVVTQMGYGPSELILHLTKVTNGTANGAGVRVHVAGKQNVNLTIQGADSKLFHASIESLRQSDRGNMDSFHKTLTTFLRGTHTPAAPRPAPVPRVLPDLSGAKAPAAVPIEGDEQGGQFTYLGLMARVKKALSEGILVKVPAVDIRPYANQPRKHFNKDRQRNLRNSVALGGQTTVALIRRKPDGNTEYELIDGERRWRGIMEIPEEERPLYEAKLIEAEDDVVQYLISGIANFNREPHTPAETVDTIVRLHEEFEIPVPEIATLLGISDLWARDLYGVRNLHPKLRERLDPSLPREDQVTITAAIQLSKADPSIQLQIEHRLRVGMVSMAGLRSEVIRTAHKTNTAVRTREVPPHKKWDTCDTRIGLIDRTSSNLLEVLGEKDVIAYVKTNKGEIASVLRRVKASIRTLEKCQTALERAQE